MTTVTADEFVITGGGSSSFVLRSRAGVTAFPAGYLQPQTDDKAMALDLMPKGTPVEVSGHGFAWVDVCDKDLEADPTIPTVAARLGVRSDCAVVGAYAFNGAAPRRVYFATGTSPNGLKGFYLETTGRLTTKASTTTDAGFCLTPGAAPTSPENGETWSVGNDVFIRLGGVTRKFLTEPV